MDDISVFCKLENEEPRPFFDRFSYRHISGQKSIRRRLEDSVISPFISSEALSILIAGIELGSDLAGIYRDVAQRTRPGSLDRLQRCSSRNAAASSPRPRSFAPSNSASERRSFEHYVHHSSAHFLQEDPGFLGAPYFILSDRSRKISLLEQVVVD